MSSEAKTSSPKRFLKVEDHGELLMKSKPYLRKHYLSREIFWLTIKTRFLYTREEENGQKRRVTMKYSREFVLVCCGIYVRPETAYLLQSI